MGATAASGEDVCGYSILQAASAQDVTNLLDGHPHLEMSGASIDVLEMLSMPGS